MPERVKLSRRKGWRKPENTLVVARPSRWGNPFSWASQPTRDPVAARAAAVQQFRSMIDDDELRERVGYPSDDEIRASLAGKNLACWCPLDGPCHADVLLEIANRG
jgi:hypothetical protein